MLAGGVAYNSGPYMATFHAGETHVSFDINIINDNIFEGDENFDLTIDPSSLPSIVIISDPSEITVTIVDDIDDDKYSIVTC